MCPCHVGMQAGAGGAHTGGMAKPKVVLSMQATIQTSSSQDHPLHTHLDGSVRAVAR